MNKKDLRKKYKEKRSNLSHSKRDELSSQIRSQLLSNFDFKGKIVSVFLPIDRFSEVVTWPIIEDESFVRVLPVVASETDLKHIKYISKDQIKITKWGIPEPLFGEEYKAEEFDFVIVPLLTINEEGFRVGFGKGYYDSFLSSCKPECKFIGLGFYNEFEAIDDLHENDIPLHYLITPDQVYNF
jgi:5-formyltetrahydrofolate cyclo-ligase